MSEPKEYVYFPSPPIWRGSYFRANLSTRTTPCSSSTPKQQSRRSFLRYSNAKRVNSTLFDRTNGASTGYSERLNGSANEKFGLAKSVSVMPGDTIKMEVYAKYVDSNTANWTGALNTLMGQISANTAGVVVDGTTTPPARLPSRMQDYRTPAAAAVPARKPF